MKYDFFAEEWHHKCGACGTDLYTPTKGDMLHNFDKHTHSDECLGGW